MHASTLPKSSKPNTEVDSGTLHNVTPHEASVPTSTLLSQPTNLNFEDLNLPSSLVIPPPSDFNSGRFDDLPPIVPPPPTFQEDSLLQNIISDQKNSQPNYIFINNINEFGGLPAAIRTANYVRPDSTYETFSEAFFEGKPESEKKHNKFPKIDSAKSSKKEKIESEFTFDLPSAKYRLSSTELTRVSPEECVETQYDLVFEKDIIQENIYTSGKFENNCSHLPASSLKDVEENKPPPLPKTPPPPLPTHPPRAVSKYVGLLSKSVPPGKSPVKPEPPPRPKPATTNPHAEGLESRRRVFGSTFLPKVNLCCWRCRLVLINFPFSCILPVCLLV